MLIGLLDLSVAYAANHTLHTDFLKLTDMEALVFSNAIFGVWFLAYLQFYSHKFMFLGSLLSNHIVWGLWGPLL